MVFFDVDGTEPVSYPALISTVDEDGSFMLSPVLPVFIFGLRATINLEINSKTTRNLTRTGECVLNLSSNGSAAAVDHLAQSEGALSEPQKGSKLLRSYYSKEFHTTRLTPAPSEVVLASRALECPVQLEVAMTGRQRLNRERCVWGHHTLTIEVRILRVFIDPSTALKNSAKRGEPNLWKLMACLQEAHQPS